MGGPQCRLWILRNGNVPCHYFRNVPVDSKIVQCRLSILRNGNVPCHYFYNFPVEFKGQGPYGTPGRYIRPDVPMCLMCRL